MKLRIYPLPGGESGSADTVRDPRGFAVKFYTEDGNWDLVGNNTPIFFIRDPILVSASDPPCWLHEGVWLVWVGCVVRLQVSISVANQCLKRKGDIPSQC